MENEKKEEKAPDRESFSQNAKGFLVSKAKKSPKQFAIIAVSVVVVLFVLMKFIVWHTSTPGFEEQVEAMQEIFNDEPKLNVLETKIETSVWLDQTVDKFLTSKEFTYIFMANSTVRYMIETDLIQYSKDVKGRIVCTLPPPTVDIRVESPFEEIYKEDADIITAQFSTPQYRNDELAMHARNDIQKQADQAVFMKYAKQSAESTFIGLYGAIGVNEDDIVIEWQEVVKSEKEEGK